MFKYDKKKFAIKASSLSIKNASKMQKSLGRKQPTGAMPKRQAQSVDYAAQRQTTRDFIVIENENVLRRGYTNVLDNGYSGESQTCVLCGSSVCKINSLKIPIESLIRFKDENFSCDRVIAIFNELKTEFKDNIEIKDRVCSMRANLAILKQNNHFVLTLFEKSKLEIAFIINSLEKQANLIVDRFIGNTQRELNLDKQKRDYNKIQNKLVFYREVLASGYTHELKREFERVKAEIETIESKLKSYSRFSFPVLLSKEEVSNRLTDAENCTNTQKKKAILKRVKLTEYVLSLG